MKPLYDVSEHEKGLGLQLVMAAMWFADRTACHPAASVNKVTAVLVPQRSVTPLCVWSAESCWKACMNAIMVELAYSATELQ